jgi:quercetin dioxygenase-like cupin family protein
MKLLKYLKLPFLFDAALLKQDVNSLLNNNWLAHYQTKHYEGEWSAIPLRSVNGNTESIIVSPTENATYNNTVFLQQSTYLQKVISQFNCPLQAVRLLKLNAGAIIKEHRDDDLYFEKGEIRIHIPVVTHTHVEFYLQDEQIVMNEGECWYMNFNLPHRISNNSPINRIHLVIDAVVNDWVKEKFNDSSIKTKKEIEVKENDYSVEQKKEMIYQLRQQNSNVANQLADNLEKELLQANTIS